jgi:hypothetical protein
MSPTGMDRRGSLRDGRIKHWWWADNVIWEMGLSKHALVVYFYLCRVAGDANSCWPSLKKISAKTRCGRTAVIEAIKELETAGLVESKQTFAEDGSQGSNVYILFNPQGEGSGGDTPQSARRTGGVRIADGGSAPGDHKEETSEENILKKKSQNPAPDGEAEQQAHQAQGLLLVEAEAVEEPHGPARPADVPTHAAAARNGHGPAAAAPARRGHPAIALFFDRWKAQYGKAPTINSKRIGILTQIYKGLGLEAPEEYPRLLDALFSSADRFIIDNAHSPEVFQTKLDVLRVNGHGSPLSVLGKHGEATMRNGMEWIRKKRAAAADGAQL